MAKNKNSVDAIVTLGLQLEANGRERPPLIQRVNKSVELFKMFSASLSDSEQPPYMIMAGDRSASAPIVPLRKEAEVMKERAASLGVPVGRILEEAQSLCTWGNALFTGKILAEKNLRRVTIVSDDYHLHFGMIAFRHVLGEDYDLIPQAAAIAAMTPERIAYEKSAAETAQAIIASTEPGDVFAIQSKLVELVPAYADLFAQPAIMQQAA
jgi:uncharacterized SAM-binding protein YcdF (DUF218 family)